MGLFDKIFGKEKSETPNLEELMNEEGDVVNPPADFYIKRIDLRNEGDADLVIKELSEKNIIILNVMPISKQPNRLKGIIAKLKNNATKINGDISLISKESGLLILTPTNVKIVKSKKKPSTGATLIS